MRRSSSSDLMTPESARIFREVTFPKFRRDGFLDGAEFEYRRKDGSAFIGAVNATSVYDGQGRYLMSRSTVYDITARKKTEARLAALDFKADTRLATANIVDLAAYTAMLALNNLE